MTLRNFCILLAVLALTSIAATSQLQPGVSTLPNVIKYSGIIKDATSGTVGVTFAIYDKQDSVSPTWLETQSVVTDESGHYNVILGSTKDEGLPASIFASGEARWIGVRAEGQAEQPRTLLVSVPYALKAADADTLGGKPVSAFVLASANIGASSTTTAERLFGAAGPTTPTANGSGTMNLITKWLDNIGTLGDSSIFDASGLVGIGTNTPQAKLDINQITANGQGALSSNISLNNTMPITGSVVSAMNMNFVDLSTSANLSKQTVRMIYNRDATATGGVNAFDSVVTAGSFLFGNAPYQLRGMNVEGPNVTTGKTLDTYYGAYFSAPSGGGAVTNNFALVTAPGAGNVGIGTTFPAATLDVNGQFHLSGTQIFGDGSQQSSAGVTQAIPNMGLTTSVLTNKLSVGLLGTCAINQILKWSGTAWACSADQTGAGGIIYPFSSGPQSTASGAFTVTQSNSVVLPGDPTFSFATTSIPAAIVGASSATTNTAVGVAAFSNSPGAPALIGWNGSTTIDPNGDAQGIIGQTENPAGTAIEGTAKAISGNTVAIKGQVHSPNGVAIQGNDNSGTGLAGLFNGKVQIEGPLQVASAITGNGNPVSISGGMNIASGGANITGSVNIQGSLSVSGSVSKNGGTFKIDHPLDPAGKYLYHSFVESPDMMNIYNGVVTLDDKGQAWITMPDWFEALNMDFRYQLTSIGRFAPVYIATEITGNRFKISGGRAHGKVSWQVTGIRHDAWAEAHRVQVEEVKPPAERGTYISPELFTKSGSDQMATSDQPKK